MDYLWIYILIILIFVIRGVIKSAEQQRKNSQKLPQPLNTGPQPEEESPFSEIPEEFWATITARDEVATDENVVIAAEKKKPEETKKRTIARKEEPYKSDSEETGGYFADAEEVRKGIIAAEILNRKY